MLSYPHNPIPPKIWSPINLVANQSGKFAKNIIPKNTPNCLNGIFL